jgi:nitroimidazol reductase NimA-like FMN-containing flavoprotein (pyridoxamine 5'-phosphate oxidase superfamily)
VREDAAVTSHAFDVDAFLRRPLTARLATNGPTVRPVWFLWEEGAFWVLTGPWARLLGRVRADPEVALVVDECEPASGLVRQVIARGRAELLPFDVARGRRKLVRYLGRTRSGGTSGSCTTSTTIRRGAGRCGFGWSRCRSWRTT